MQFPLEINAPSRQAFAESVDSVTVPTPTGTITVLAHHIPLFTTLVDGEIKVSAGKREFFLAIGGGFMQVSHDKVIILVSRAAHADELNEAEIARARQAAQEIIARRAKGVELQAAQAILRRSVLELRVLRRVRRSGSVS